MSASASSVAELIGRGKVSSRQIAIIALCIAFNMVDGFDITTMAVTVHQIGEELQLREDSLGLVFSLSLAGMMLGALFLAGLSDVVGRKTMVIVTLLLVGSTVLATAYVESLRMLIVMRFISGLGAGAMLASVATLAAEFSPDKYRSLAVTAVAAGYPLGATLTGFVANSIVAEFGWRSMFITGGSVTLLLALVAIAFIPESLHFLCKKQPIDALAKVNAVLLKFAREPLDVLPFVEDSERATEADKQTLLEKMFSLLAPEFRHSTLILWSAFFLYISTLYVLMSWIPKMIINYGYPPEVGNLAYSLFNLGGFLGALCLGYLATRWMLSRLITTFAVIATLLMWTLSGLTLAGASQPIFMALMFMIGFSVSGGYSGMYAVPAKIYPSGIRGTGIGWAIGLGRLGAVIGPGIAGLMIASGLSITFNFAVFAIPMLIGGVLAYQLKVR